MALAPTVVGLFAAFCTTVSYIPQLRKCWSTGKTDDLSLKMFSILALGILLWVIYGVMQRDVIIVSANSISLCLLAAILFFKLREGWASSETTEHGTRQSNPLSAVIDDLRFRNTDGDPHHTPADETRQRQEQESAKRSTARSPHTLAP